MSRCCSVRGSRGIGRAVSQLLAQRGHKVVLLSRNKEAAQVMAESLPGEKHLGLSCDVSKEEDVQRAFETNSKTCGTVGYLVNAAGINRDTLLLRSKSEDMLCSSHQPAGLNADLHRRSTEHAQSRRSYCQHRLCVKGNSGQCVYSASKAGLEGFTRSLAKEVATRNIRVNSVAPGFIRTDMTAGLEKEDAVRRIPQGHFGEPAEVAHAVLFLLESPYITGQRLLVDGGLQLAL
ncbi:carbonyl reductase family member 4-like [Sinocyclocheilus grahami]|uniref:carbonyl reductase family member 4-like n=1 Tax=Sinocyclocheilus grahami TaxID=75366 RepID=UPI0007AC944D|nr:PREDICTED: carbonyl reductase family member 4-like [Sinocyclocheilus grahami]